MVWYMEDRRAEIMDRRLDGLTYQQIGEELGVSRQRVQQILSPPPAIRKAVATRAHHRCERCGIAVGLSGHIHHDNPLGREDFDDINTLQLLCFRCHRLVHGKTFGTRTRRTRFQANPVMDGRKQIALYLPMESAEKLQLLAAHRAISMSGLLREWVIDWIDEQTEFMNGNEDTK